MFDVFGSQLSQPVKFIIAFVVVLALIGLTAWLVRRFGASRLGGSTRGRQPRLAVIDAANVDGRRRLVLIRRDNIEHLLMIGGPSDVVIEANIVRAVPAREPLPARVPAPEAAARPAAADNAWPLQPLTETPPVAPAVPASRPLRAGAGDEPWLPPEPGARPRPADNLGHPSVDLAGKRPAPASGAPRIEPVPAAPASAAQADQNLAEMAQQLEAALRRGAAAEPRPPVTDALAVPPAAKSAAEARGLPRELKPRAEPHFDLRPDPKIEPKAESKPEPKLDAKAEPVVEPKSEPKPGTGKALLDNLEEEMASLLGRPLGKS